MGYEVLLFFPVIFFSGKFIVKQVQSVRWKVFWAMTFLLILLFYLFIFPAPIGLNGYKPYWRGIRETTGIWEALKSYWFRFLNFLGFEFL